MVPKTEDKVSFTNKYSLIANINHSGLLNRAIIGLLSLIFLVLFKDKLIFNVEENSLNNTTSYILFDSKV